jgi:hypothetical protein
MSAEWHYVFRIRESSLTEKPGLHHNLQTHKVWSMNVQEKDTLAPVIDLDVLEKNIVRLLISLEEEKATSGRAQLVT